MIVIIMREAAVFLGMPTAECHVGLTADNRLDSYLFGFAIKLDGAEHIAMVGHRHSRLIERLDLPDQRLNLVCAVEETELCVEMKVHEGRRHGGGFYGDREGKSNEDNVALISLRSRGKMAPRMCDLLTVRAKILISCKLNLLSRTANVALGMGDGRLFMPEQAMIRPLIPIFWGITLCRVSRCASVQAGNSLLFTSCLFFGHPLIQQTHATDGGGFDLLSSQHSAAFVVVEGGENAL